MQGHCASKEFSPKVTTKYLRNTLVRKLSFSNGGVFLSLRKTSPVHSAGTTLVVDQDSKHFIQFFSPHSHHPPLLTSSSVRVSKIEIVQMSIHTYFFFRLYSLTLIVSRLNYYLKGVLSVNASPFPVHVGDEIYLRYLVLDKLRYSQ